MSHQFSVLMSIYHKENAQHFQEALESIWDKQTLKPNELILVEDGPLTPELNAVIQAWQQKLPGQLKAIRLDHNVGTGKAKNIGLQHCQHPYVAIMDTDDLSVATRFAQQIDFLNKHPDIILVGGQIVEFEEHINNVLSQKNVPLTHEQIQVFAKKRSPFNHPSTMYRRDAILALGGYQHHLLMEDYNLWIRIIASGHRTANLEDVLVYMRSRKAMLGRRRGLNYIKSEWQLFQLKQKLKITTLATGFIILVTRSLPRLLPPQLLNVIYKLLRT